MSRRTRPSAPLVPLVPVVLATTVGLAALAAPAHADEPVSAGPSGAPVVAASAAGGPVGSLVFIRDHDVWIARGDGTGARPVTTDGTVHLAYGSPSQADDGTIAAQRGHDVVVLTPDGRLVRSFDPGPLLNSVSHPVDGVPVDVAISPDARHVAYTFVGFECTNGCYRRFATGVTRTDVLEDADQYGTSYADAPQWITGSRMLQGGGGGSDVHLQDLGSDERTWFIDGDTGSGGWDFEDLADPALSRDGRYVAAIRGYDETTHVFWYATSGDPRTDASPATPQRLCKTNQVEGLEAPTFGLDGRLAFTLDGDLYATTDPADCAAPIGVLLTDVGQPEFSAWTYRAAPPPPAAPSATARPVVRGTARVGGRLTATRGTWRGATSYAFQWLRDGRAVRGATRSAYTPVHADAGRKVAVVVTARGPGGTARATSRAVTVRR